MSEKNYIMDWVKMSNGKTLVGVVDFATDRFIHFFNFDLVDDDPNLVMAAIVWKAKYSNLRFSVFCSMYFPKLEIPQVNLINKRGIEDMSSVRHKEKLTKTTRIVLTND